MDPLGDLFIAIHSAHDGLNEPPIKNKPEIVEAIVAGLVGQTVIHHARLFKLIEEKLVTFSGVHAEALTERIGDDRGILLVGVLKVVRVGGLPLD